MSDKMRWRYGDTNPVVAAVGSSTVIEIGDLLWQDTNQAKPASTVPIGKVEEKYQDSENQAGQMFFAKHFLGVAMQRSRSGDTDPIRVATTGVFEMDCPTTNCELGDLLGVLCNPTAGLLNDWVKSVAHSKYAVGRCAKRGAALTSLLVDIRSKVMTGGVAGTSPSGV